MIDVPAAGPEAPAPQPDTRPVLVLAPLPSAWSAPTTVDEAPVPYANAILRARAKRQIVLQGVLASDDDALADAASFDRANGLVDVCNRLYAAAYHARDASAAGKLDALGEASAVLLAWSELLLRARIQSTTFRTTATVALTFEEVVHGPALRWREEGETLARQVERESNGAGKSPPQCCRPGDPLCSSSLSGWCRAP